MAEQISISEPVRRRLRSAMLEERDLLDALRRHPHQAVPGQPGSYLCVCQIAVRRPFDPETAEIRKVEITLQRAGDGWLVTAVDGLGEGIESGEIPPDWSEPE